MRARDEALPSPHPLQKMKMSTMSTDNPQQKQIVRPINISALLKQYGLRADKALGQNFLHDETVLQEIAISADIKSEDCVLEIGPGLGSLTRYLAASAREVTAVELDRELIPPLREVLTPYQNVHIVHGDILKLSISDLSTQPDYLVAANIPYNITSAILRHLLEAEVKPRRIVLTIQKEMAERICATPGSLSLLALSVQIYGNPHLLTIIPARAFYPAPKVDSAILRIDIYDHPRIHPQFIQTFFKLTKAGFSQKRKTLRNSLSAGLRLSTTDVERLLIETEIDPIRRAETLSLDEWSALCDRFETSGNLP